MSEYLKVDGFPGLVKNDKTGLYVNVDSHEIEMARARKLIKRKKLQEQEEINQTVLELKEEISEIKTLLLQLIENK
jgi:predicted RNA-binding protein YlxR (DUF448 family)